MFSISLLSYSQYCTIKLIAEDSNGLKDSIVVGFDDNSTIGIDEEFGEYDIYNLEYNSLDMRVIHRDIVEHNCLTGYNGDELYYNENIDSKIDIRPWLPYFGTIYSNAEIIVYSLNYPVTIYGDFSNCSGDMLEGWSLLHLLNDNCVEIETISIYYSGAVDILFQLNSSFTTMVAEFEHEVGIADNHIFSTQPFPNPTNGKISFEFKADNIQKLVIFDLLGRNVFEKIEVEQNETLDLTNFENGIYIIQFQTDKGIFSTKIMKQ